LIVALSSKAKLLDACAHERVVQLSFIRPGKPNENACIERSAVSRANPNYRKLRARVGTGERG
jgi:hypothetical protein